MDSPTFCLLPWVSMAVRNNGDYRVCCHANTGLGRGLLHAENQQVLNAGDVGVAEARNSPTLKAIRKSMIEGQWPAACARCQKEEAAGIRSKRIYSKDTLPKDLDQKWAESITDTDGKMVLEKSPLLDLDVRFGNKCNLACRMCGPSDSSAWISDYEKLGGTFKPGRFDWYEQEPFWNSLEVGSSHLEHIYVVGGEPLLIDRHYVFLKHLIDIGRAEKITLEYNTNLTVLPEKALELWHHFQKVRIGVSFDGAKEVNDYIRFPSKFAVLERNLDKIDKASGRFQVWLACTVSAYNIHHLVDLMRWVHSKKFARIGKTSGKEFFVPHPVHMPEHLNVQAFPAEIKKATRVHLEQELAAFLTEPDLTESERVRAGNIVQQYLRFMEARSIDHHWPQFLEYTKKLDVIRSQDFKTLKAIYDI